MFLFDSHCHLNFPEYEKNRGTIIADCLQKEIGLINIGTSLKTSAKVVAIANQYPTAPVYAATGLYPAHFSNTEYDAHEKELKDPDNFFNPEFYQKLIDSDKKNVETRFITSPKIIAMGEIGLEYSNVPDGRDLAEIKNLQKQGFIDQLNFAQKNNLPIILHARGSGENPNDAYEDMLEILTASSSPFFLSSSRKRGSRGYEISDPPQMRGKQVGDDKKITGVLHCFSSTTEIAQKFLDLGFYLGFTGIITFKNKSIDNLRQVVKMVPLERILIETDAPYLTPEPYRGEINKPQYVALVAAKIAEIKKVDYQKVADITTHNAKALFKV